MENDIGAVKQINEDVRSNGILDSCVGSCDTGTQITAGHNNAEARGGSSGKLDALGGEYEKVGSHRAAKKRSALVSESM